MSYLNETQENVKEYYGKKLSHKDDLKTSACCLADSMPEHHKKILNEIDSEILDRFYGCGSPIPPALEGKVVLDLGCGTGRDVYLASKLAGPGGWIIGVDMTEDQLEIARKHRDSQARRFGFEKSNVEFLHGYIEDLRSLGIEDNSVDVVISNCVFNLSADKKATLTEIFRVLKPGGELYFSDVFSGRRIPEHLQSDPVLYGECLSGALYIEDFRRILREIGVLDYRVVSRKSLALDDPEVKAKLGMIDFYSMTVRAFKLDSLEDICEDYGQIAVYKGTLPEFPHRYDLDDHHGFITGKPMLICGNTAAMLNETRYAQHFNVVGDRSTHYGPFNCKPVAVPPEINPQNAGGSCC